MKLRIILADDHTLLLDAFKELLEPDFDVVATVTDGHALVAAAKKLKPDIIVVDIGMPRLNGLDAGRQIKQEMPGVKLIFLTMNQDPTLAAEALRSGASGYLLKNCAASELIKAINETARGLSYVTPLITQDVVEALVKDTGKSRSVTQLTLRQREVLQLLAEGNSMKGAAKVLKLAPRTIAFHKYRIMEKFHLKTNVDLLQFAIDQNLVLTERAP